MDRASLIFSRPATRSRTDDFEDTVPNTLMLAMLDRAAGEDPGQPYPAHWGLPNSFRHQAPEVPLESTSSGFSDTVPYDLDDELGAAAPAASRNLETDYRGLLLGPHMLADVPERAKDGAMPAHFKRQALGPGLALRAGPESERPSVDNTGGFPETVLQSLSDFEANRTPSSAPSRASSSAPRAVPTVSSKGGRVQPMHWGLSPDVDEHATEVALPHLRMVGIADLKQVSSHVTSRAAGATRHIVRFRNGGFVRFAYGIDDSVVELSGERITVRIGVQGDVLITALAPNGAA